MRWLLAGCCALALIGLSEALHVAQRPRFYGVQASRQVHIYCFSNQSLQASWFKADVYDDANKPEVVEGGRISFFDQKKDENACLRISSVQVEDSGVYFCKMNNTWGPGTQLIVVKAVDLSKAESMTTMKDALIFLQGLLLAGTVAAILLRGRTVSEKREIIYEEPETDHIYEGLEIERCDGGLYEELSVYAQADEAEAPWE